MRARIKWMRTRSRGKIRVEARRGGTILPGAARRPLRTGALAFASTIMPTYDYECQKCGHRFEVFQSMKDDRLTDCPLDECEGAVKRLLGTGAGIIFKGSGFYQTDCRSDSYKKGAEADKPKKDSKSSDSGSSGKKSESKSSSGDSSGSSSKPASKSSTKSDS